MPTVVRNISKSGPGIHPRPMPLWWVVVLVPSARPPRWMAGSEMKEDVGVECPACQILVPKTLEPHIDQIFGCDGIAVWDTRYGFICTIHAPDSRGQKAPFLPSVLTINAILLTNEFMQCIKFSGIFLTIEQCLKRARLRSHQLSTGKPHLSGHGSYLRTRRTSCGVFSKILNIKDFNLLFN